MTDTMTGAPRLHRNGRTEPSECRCPVCASIISPTLLASILGQQRAAALEIEKAVEARFVREMAKVEASKKADINAARREAARIAETKLTALRANQEAMIAARLETQRQTFEKATAGAVLAERAKYIGEKLKLEEQLQDMQRRLQSKTAHQLGEPAEIDLFDALATAFPADRVSRVVKGVRGPDVVVEVVDHGEVVGSVVLDSKNHARWSNRFTTKLRSDQLAEGADFAILSSSVFPAGAQQLHIQDGVIVASPARVVVLVHLLRRQIIENHLHKLSGEARTERASELYAYIASPAGAELLERPGKSLDGLVNLRAKEVEQQLAVHRKRGELIRAIQRDHEEFVAAIDRIIGGASAVAGEASV